MVISSYFFFPCNNTTNKRESGSMLLYKFLSCARVADLNMITSNDGSTSTPRNMYVRISSFHIHTQTQGDKRLD